MDETILRQKTFDFSSKSDCFERRRIFFNRGSGKKRIIRPFSEGWMILFSFLPRSARPRVGSSPAQAGNQEKDRFEPEQGPVLA